MDRERRNENLPPMDPGQWEGISPPETFESREPPKAEGCKKCGGVVRELVGKELREVVGDTESRDIHFICDGCGWYTGVIFELDDDPMDPYGTN